MRPIDRLVKQITQGVSPKSFHQHRYRLHNFNEFGEPRTVAEITQLANSRRKSRNVREARLKQQSYVPMPYSLESMSDTERQFWTQLKETKKQ